MFRKVFYFPLFKQSRSLLLFSGSSITIPVSNKRRNWLFLQSFSFGAVLVVANIIFFILLVTVLPGYLEEELDMWVAFTLPNIRHWSQ